MQNEIVIFKALTTNEKLNEIEAQSEKFKGLVVDMAVNSERKHVKESAKVITDILKSVDRFRIDTSADYKVRVEAEATQIKERLEAANLPLTNLMTKYKADCQLVLDKEKARCAIVEAAFTAINDSAMEAIGQTSTVIEAIIDDMETYEFDPEVLKSRSQEFTEKHCDLMKKLHVMLAAQVAAEKAQEQQEEFEAMKEAQRLRVESEERVRLDAEIAIKATAEAEARHIKQTEESSERARIATIEREKRMTIDKKEAEERAIQQAELAAKFERDKIAAEQAAEQARKDKLEANKKHVGAVRCEIKTHIMKVAGVDEATAKKVVMALLKTERVTINY